MIGPIEEVSAQSETFIRTRTTPDGEAPVTIDDASSALIRFAGGARGTVEMARMAVRRPCDFSVGGERDKGTLVFNYPQMNELLVRRRRRRPRPLRHAAHPGRAPEPSLRIVRVADRPGHRLRRNLREQAMTSFATGPGAHGRRASRMASPSGRVRCDGAIRGRASLGDCLGDHRRPRRRTRSSDRVRTLDRRSAGSNSRVGCVLTPASAIRRLAGSEWFEEESSDHAETGTRLAMVGVVLALVVSACNQAPSASGTGGPPPARD